jgi:peptidyl-prolyl cis-trans isomerase D
VDSVTDAQESTQNQQLLAQLSEQLNQQLSQDIFSIFSDDVVRRAVPLVDQQAVNAVHVNFP